MLKSLERSEEFQSDTGIAKNIQAEISESHSIDWSNKWDNQWKNKRDTTTQRNILKTLKRFQSISKCRKKVDGQCESDSEIDPWLRWKQKINNIPSRQTFFKWSLK